mgnify:CR=1 FL=1
MAQPVLKCQHLGIQFGGLKAVDDFNMEIGESELVGLIGPNGAGKTTVLNLLGGMASVTIVKDADGTHVSEYDLQPTVNVILRNANTGWYTYRPMLLDSYGTELAAQNRFSECTVDAMWALYEDITG